MSIIQFLFGFHGRVRRLHLWLFTLVMWLIGGGLFWQLGHFGMHHGGDMMMSHDAMSNMTMSMSTDRLGGIYFVTHNPFAGLFGLVGLWMQLAVLVKRWHDRDKSGWMVLLILIPIVNIVGVIWTFIECGCLDGTLGPNKYGPDPKNR